MRAWTPRDKQDGNGNAHACVMCAFQTGLAAPKRASAATTSERVSTPTSTPAGDSTGSRFTWREADGVP